MDEARFAHLIDLVGEAMERAPEERDAFLVSSCARDPALLEEARVLVAEADGTSPDDVTGRLESILGRAAAASGVGEGAAHPARIGSYEIVRVLGGGGMGVVYLGRQDQPIKRDVAVKVVRRSLVGRDTLARFRAERQALALMQHPNIAHVFDAGTTDDDLPYFVMELVEGPPITEYCEGNRLGLHERLELFGAVCHAVHHAHQRGVIHRDLKPSNILVVRTDGRPTPKVIDFGVAKATEGALTDETLHTALGSPIGTLEYMSPEQVRGVSEEIDTRTDVYALGVVLYELVAGRHPFAGTALKRAGLLEAQRIILETDPPRPSTATGGAPRDPSGGDASNDRPPRRRMRKELDWVVMKALEKERERRYASALDLGRELERYARNEPVRAGPPGLTYRARKLARRHRVGLSVVPLVVLALLAGSMLDRGGAEIPAEASVAVLPFTDTSPDADQTYFSDGLSEGLLNALARTPGLRVAARSSSFQFRGSGVDVQSVGRRLGVAAVVEGSVRVEADSLRITVQLSDASSGYLLWSARYDRPMRDVFTIQEEVARAVAGSISAELLPPTLMPSRTASLEAYRLYLRGRHEWRRRTEEGMWAALESFSQAVGLDPGYAAAYAGLADTWQLLPDYGDVAASEGLARAKTAALRAVALDSTLAEAHVSLAALLDDYDRDRKGAESAYRRAIELNPGYATARHWLAIHLADEGRFEEALAEIEQARRLDPLSDIVNTAAGAVRYFARDYDGAMAEYRAVLDLEPDFALGWALLGRVQLVSGQVDEAVTSLGHSVDLSEGDPSYGAVYAAALAEAGRSAEARALADRVRAGHPVDYVPYCELAAAYIRLDDEDEALAQFRLCFEERDPALKHIRAEPLYDAIRPHPDFKDLVRRAGFEEL